MSGRITDKLSGSERDEALAFLDQAQRFYIAAGAEDSANPLLYYYSFLNLAKPLIRARGFGGSLEVAIHGLSNKRVSEGSSPKDFEVKVQKLYGQQVNVFVELSDILGFGRPSPGTSYNIEELMVEMVVGHRLWREATHSRERFVPLAAVEILQNVSESAMWIRLLVKREDVDRFGIGHTQTLREGRLIDDFRLVKGEGVPPGCFGIEQKAIVKYGQRPSDRLPDLVGPLRAPLWRIVTSNPGQSYRKYYLHLTPAGASRLPQLLALWALLFHYGSMVRYQPHVFAAMTRDRYGAFIREFVAAQPEQMLYLLASEMCEREVAKPAIA
jgi:hypothetical protein